MEGRWIKTWDGAVGLRVCHDGCTLWRLRDMPCSVQLDHLGIRTWGPGRYCGEGLIMCVSTR